MDRRTPSTGRARRGVVRDVVLLGLVAVLAVAPTRKLMVPPAKGAPVVDDIAPLAIAGRLSVGASLNAFGNSGQVKLRFALPGDDVEFPLEVSGDPSQLTYEWVELRDTTLLSIPKLIVGASFTAPDRPGFYRLAIVRAGERHVVSEPTLVVMVPFTQKLGSS